MNRIGDNTLPWSSASLDPNKLASQITNFYAELSSFQNTFYQIIVFTSNSWYIELFEQSNDPYGIEGLLEVNCYQGATFSAQSHYLTFRV